MYCFEKMFSFSQALKEKENAAVLLYEDNAGYHTQW